MFRNPRCSDHSRPLINDAHTSNQSQNHSQLHRNRHLFAMRTEISFPILHELTQRPESDVLHHVLSSIAVKFTDKGSKTTEEYWTCLVNRPNSNVSLCSFSSLVNQSFFLWQMFCFRRNPLLRLPLWDRRLIPDLVNAGWVMEGVLFLSWTVTSRTVFLSSLQIECNILVSLNQPSLFKPGF